MTKTLQLAIALTFGVTTIAHAGGLAETVMEPDAVEAATVSPANGALVALLLLLVIAAAASGGGNGGVIPPK